MKQFNVPAIYRSTLIAAVKNSRKVSDKMKKDFSPTLLDFGEIQIYLSRHFGLCYGVENAIDIAFRTIDRWNPGTTFQALFAAARGAKFKALRGVLSGGWSRGSHGQRVIQILYRRSILPVLSHWGWAQYNSY